jgi:hypothetical protein
MFDEYTVEHLDLLHEDDYRPPLCSNFNTSKDIVCLKEVTHDFSSQPPVISLPCFSVQGVVGKYLFRVEFPPGQTLDFKGWLGNTISNQFFNLLLMMCQSPTNFLSILPLEHEVKAQRRTPARNKATANQYMQAMIQWVSTS